MLRQSIKLGFNGVKDGSAYRVRKMLGRHQYPTFLVFQLTGMCNSRCTMCSIWKKPKGKELSARQIEKIFSNKLFSKVRWINLTGGEPFLRPDFLKVVDALSRLPQLEGIAVPSNGFLTDKIVKTTEEALKILGRKKFLSITLSVDGFEKTHDEIRGVPGCYRKVMRTLDELNKLKAKHPNFNVGVQPTITRQNLPEIEKFYRFIKTKSNSVGFAVMMQSKGYYDNVDSQALDDRDKRKIAEFFRKIIKEDPQYGYYYKGLIKLFQSGRRQFTCLGGHVSLFMSPDGSMYPCPALSFNKAYSFGNAKDDAYHLWFSENAKEIKKRLKICGMCRQCSMMCDFINVAKVEFFEHAGFLVLNPGIAYNLVKKVARERNPYF